MNETDKTSTRRHGSPFKDGAGYDYQTWWRRFDDATSTERRIMTTGKYHADRFGQ